MNLFKLAISSFVFTCSKPYDRAYRCFMKETTRAADLARPEHRRALLTWLRAWGCRNLSKDDKSEQLASSELEKWWLDFGEKLVPVTRGLLELTHTDLADLEAAYDALSSRHGAVRPDGVSVRIGPTAASKILFAIRPGALVPWDKEIRKAFGNGANGPAYASYVKQLQITARDLEECTANQFKLDELPGRLGQPNVTIPYLLNSYYWATMSHGVELPSDQVVSEWGDWARQRSQR